MFVVKAFSIIKLLEIPFYRIKTVLPAGSKIPKPGNNFRTSHFCLLNICMKIFLPYMHRFIELFIIIKFTCDCKTRFV